MDSLFWQLGGPRRFVKRAADDLREGRNLVFCLPEHSAPRIGEALRRFLDDGSSWAWQKLALCGDDCRHPASFLTRRFVPDFSNTAIANVGTLTNNEAFAGRILWLEDMHSAIWPAWRGFLEEYSHACRARSVWDRTLLCVPLVGDLAEAAPAEDICLAKHVWSGVVDSLDMLVLSSHLLRERAIPGVQKRVLAAVCASLSLWDPEVAEWLTNAGVDAILKPDLTLRMMARDRGWSAERSAAHEMRWSLGMKDMFEGCERVHSAVLVLDDKTGEIGRRVWSGQVGVLFPLVEERRQMILKELAQHLVVPYRTRFGSTITDWRDLEIGHIESQIVGNNLPVSADTRCLLRQLRQIRNCLAHQDTVSRELLFDAVLTET